MPRRRGRLACPYGSRYAVLTPDVLPPPARWRKRRARARAGGREERVAVHAVRYAARVSLFVEHGRLSTLAPDINRHGGATATLPDIAAMPPPVPRSIVRA